MDSLTPNPTGLKPRPRTGRGRWTAALLSLLVLAAIVGVVRFWPAPTGPAATRNRDRAQAVPVVVATAGHRDMPIMLDGLGTVQAFNTVTIKPMVDGPLISVNFTEGQTVHKGDVLARIDPRPLQAALDQVTARKAQDEALLANARVDLARYQKLVGNNYTSAQQADTAKALVAQYDALVRQDQAQIDTARTNLSYTTIVAPLDGRTGVRMVDQGNIVRASDPAGLVVIAQLQPIFVVFTLPQQAVPAVIQAMNNGRPEVLATPQGASGSEVLDTGVLTVLDNQVDPATGTIKLKASFPNKDGRLWPGGFVAVRLQVAIATNAVVVPAAAVQRGPRGDFVFVVGKDDTVTRRAITTGYEDGQVTIVEDGLQGGEQVVTDGASRLSDAAKVTIVQPVAATQAPGRERPRAPGAERRWAQ